MTSIKIKSKEVGRWMSATKPYTMDCQAIFKETTKALIDFVKLNKKGASLIIINADVEKPLLIHSAMYSRTSGFNPKDKTIGGVPYRFKRNPDYDYVVK